VVELVRAGGGGSTIERIDQTPVMRLRDRLLPLVSLSRLLKLDDAEEVREEDAGFVVVTQVGPNVFGIIVDKVFDTEEIVVKPVAPILRHVTMFSGNTILGDGSVIMILDPNGIARATGVGADGPVEDAARAAARVGARSGERTALLLFRAGDETPKAVPLGLVARLEDLPAASIEVSGSQPLVQYRGKLMPLVPMSGHWMPPQPGTRQAVLVFSDQHRAMGLMVDAILDVVEEHLDIEGSHDRPGFLGSAVIGGKVTDVMDCAWWLRQAGDDWFKPQPQGENTGKRVLLAEDSAFFRHLLVPGLTAAGYEVTAVETGSQALRLREQGAMFDIIISDIEMPELDGLGLARAVREGGIWQHLPMIAMSAHAEPGHSARCRNAGFTGDVGKSDREALLSLLRDSLSPAVH